MSERKKRGETSAPETQAGENREPEKNLFEVAREIDRREKREAELRERKRQQKEAEEAYAEREKYGEKLAEEKRELMRLRQGLIEESETIREETEEKKHYTLWQRIKNYFYHNGWWMGIAAFFAVVIVVLCVDYFSQVEPDVIVMMLAKNDTLNLKSVQMSDYFEQFCDDLNGDGEVKVDIYYIPVGAEGGSYYDATSTKLMVQYHSAEAMIVIGNKACEDTISPEDTLVDLESVFPGNPNVKDHAFLLEGTDFAEKIGYEYPMEDTYLAIRSVQQRSFATVEEMQESYDRSFPILEKIIQDLTPEETE